MPFAAYGRTYLAPAYWSACSLPLVAAFKRPFTQLFRIRPAAESRKRWSSELLTNKERRPVLVRDKRQNIMTHGQGPASGTRFTYGDYLLRLDSACIDHGSRCRLPLRNCLCRDPTSYRSASVPFASRTCVALYRSRCRLPLRVGRYASDADLLLFLRQGGRTVAKRHAVRFGRDGPRPSPTPWSRLACARQKEGGAWGWGQGMREAVCVCVCGGQAPPT